MSKYLLLSSAAFLLWVQAGPSLAQEDTKAIIEKAVNAHGGAEKLAKLDKKAIITKAKGTVNQLGGLDLTMEVYISEKGKFKNIIQTEVMGVKITQTQVFDGEKYWLNVNGMDLSSLLDEKALAEGKEQFYQETVFGKVLMGDKSIELSPLGEVQVDGKPARGIRVVSKGHRDVNLYFDKESGLIIKVEFRALDILSKQEKLTEKLLSGHKEMDGVMTPTKVSILQDGNKFLDLEILEIKTLDAIDDSEFVKP